MNNKETLEYLTGLRGWAALIVVFTHLICFLFLNTISYPVIQVFSIAGSNLVAPLVDSSLAVQIFYVLSGFVLSLKFVRAPTTFSLPEAVTSRYFRLAIPIAAISLFAFILMHMGLMFNADAATLTLEKGGQPNTWLASYYSFDPTLKSYILFSFYHAFYHYGDPSYIPPAWTISYEYAGSLLIYFVIAVFGKEKPDQPFQLPVVILAGVLFIAAPSTACFLFGYFIATIFQRWGQPITEWKHCNRLFVLLSLIPPLTAIFCPPTHIQYTALLAALLVASVVFSRSLQSFFSCGVSRFLGKISFPLYLVHVILICSFSSYLMVELNKRGIDLETMSYITAAATIILALCVSYAFLPIEIFSIRISRQIARTLCGHRLLDKIKSYSR